MIVSTQPKIELLNIDCMEYMAGVPDKFFDLAIVDPPYGIGFGEFNRTNKDSQGNKFKANKYKNSNWDDATPDSKYFFELERISKNRIVWGGNYYFDLLGNSKGLICWYKHQPVNNFADCEYAWTNIDKPAKVFDFQYYGNLEGNTTASEKIHPTQKPVKLYRWLLKNYAKEGDKILDTHGGSMSSAIACHQMGFDLTLCELDKDYYEAGVKRFREQTMQQSLFKPHQ
jgi:site-specific DNA-methyltransferase (adenine-specific)